MAEEEKAMYESIDKAFALQYKKVIDTFFENIDTKSGQNQIVSHMAALMALGSFHRVTAYAEHRLADLTESSKITTRGIASETGVQFDRTVNVDEVAKYVTQSDVFKDAIKTLLVEVTKGK